MVHTTELIIPHPGLPRIRPSLLVSPHAAHAERRGCRGASALDPAGAGGGRPEEHSIRQHAGGVALVLRELRLLRKGIESRLVSIEELLRNHKGTLHKSELSGIEQALKRGRMALLKSSDRSNLSDLGKYLERVETHVRSKLP